MRRLLRATDTSELTEVVEHVLEDEEERQLRELRLPAGEWHLPCLEADSLSNRVEHPDLYLMSARQT
jgi:hypothetical protein